MAIKQVWFNINTGEFSNSWDVLKLVSVLSNKKKDEAAVRGWKLIQYECLNDSQFELCNLM